MNFNPNTKVLIEKKLISILMHPTWKQFQMKTENIDQIAKWTLNHQTQKISEKYNNIENTIKILNSLMQDFTKKADNFEKNLKKKTRIQELQYQNSYYKERIKECMVLSEQLRKTIDSKKKQIEVYETKVDELKRKLIISKTSNIKFVMKIEELQRKIEQEKENKEIIVIKKIKKNKKTFERSLMTTKNIMLDPLENLMKQKNTLQKRLFHKIDGIINLRWTMKESYRLLKQKLKLHEQKSNIFGLSGSLLFRLNRKNNQLSSTNNRDPKLIIYDVLREKHERIKKQKIKDKENFHVNEDQFLRFNPIQILGIIELKGGFETLFRQPFEKLNAKSL